MGKKKLSKAGKKTTTKAKKPSKAATPKKSAKGKSTTSQTKKRKSTATTTSSPKNKTRRAPGPAKKPAAKRAAATVKRPATGKGKPRSNSDSAPKEVAAKVAAPTRKRRIAAGELAKIREFLSTKKRAIANHLQAELAELEKPEKRHRADLEEIASDTHDTDSLCQIMDIEATQIDQIDMALAKIENGTYGVCEDCSDEIPMARLEALPFATQCIECKRKAELAGQISALGST
jgi:RNA polymerase-binding protein DksA